MPMLPHRPRHTPAREAMDVESARASTSTLTTYQSSGAVSHYRSRSGDRLWSRAERSQLSLIALPIPRLHRNMRSMSVVPTKRSLAGVEEPSVALSVPLDSNGNGLGTRKGTRLFAAIRRSENYNFKRSSKALLGRGMFSTPEERSASASPVGSRTTSPTRNLEPPSITQIAMGLHTSRTPHLGPTHGLYLGSDPGARSAAHLHPHTRGRASISPSRPQTASSSTRVATPLRSSLKKANASRSASPSASASSVPTPSTSRSTFSRLSLAISASRNSGRSRLDKFLGRGVKSPSSSVASMNSSETDLGTPRKAVRFVAIVEDEVARTPTVEVSSR